jgi:hypothetical protein
MAGDRQARLLVGALWFGAGLMATPSWVQAQAEPAEDLPPVLSLGSVAPSGLPKEGGEVTVSVKVVDDVGVEDVYAELLGPEGSPISKALLLTSGNVYSASVTLPPNASESAISYQVNVTATDTNGGTTLETIGEVQVAETPPFNETPILDNPEVTPTSLPNAGGTVTLSVTATDTGGITEAHATITLPGGSTVSVALEPVGNDRFEGEYAAPANITFSGESYMVVFEAADDIGQTSSINGSEFVVAGQVGGGEGDADGDGTLDVDDGCPLDGTKTDGGVCGCGNPDTDSDQDGALDCQDQCPGDPDKISEGICGCGAFDGDSDTDGVADCNDNCPDDSQKSSPGECGCGETDVDADGDGLARCNDGCVDDPLKGDPGVCGCGVAETEGCGTPEPVVKVLLEPRAFEGAEGGCARGGLAVSFGLDLDGTDTLEDVEIEGTDYFCKDEPRAVLVAQRELALGDENCPDGGLAFSTGLDDDGNGTLEDSEILSTHRLCTQTSPGTPGLVARVLTLAVGNSSCPAGGSQIDTGLDLNTNGTLEDAEVQNSNAICASAEQPEEEEEEDSEPEKANGDGDGGCTVAPGRRKAGALAGGWLVLLAGLGASRIRRRRAA